MKALSLGRLTSALAVTIGALAAAPVSAQGTFTAADTGDTCNPGTSVVAAYSCTKGSVTASMKAFGFTGNSLSSTAQTGFQSGLLADFNASGFGAFSGNRETNTSGQHAFDSMTTSCGTTSNGHSGLSTSGVGCGGSIEALLLDFGSSKVKLSDVGVGWTGGDADMMIWAYTGGANVSDASTLVTGATAKGSTTPTCTAPSTTCSTSAALSGWTLVKNLDFTNSSTSSQFQAFTGSVYSSYFLITTYFGAAGSGLDAGDDAFKIDRFTVDLCTGTTTNGGSTCTTTGVSAPGTLALAGLGLVGAGLLRRRRG